MTTDRTVTLSTIDHGDVTLTCPPWCAGHADYVPVHRVDITHYGPEHRLTHNGDELYRLVLAQSPHADLTSREVCAYVEESAYTGSLDPAGLYDLAAALDQAADQMRAFADQLAAVLGGDR